MLPRRRLLLLTGIAILAPALLAFTARGAWAQGGKLKIGIIGTGRIGGTLAELWAKAGHELVISSRHPEQLEALAERLGPKTRVGTPAEAAAFGEVVLISVPYGALPQVGRDYATQLQGKVVLETGNPFPHRDGAMAHEARRKGTGVASAQWLPGVRLVRAFSTIPHHALRSEAHRPGERVAVPLAGDDPQALEIAARLVEDAGFEPVVVGPLARASQFDVGTPVFARALTARELRQALGM
ncbi:NADPH-dependent F420 reductase [Pelomicrobium sp.]|jgi:predicted dinucleotide-binding enzyme|uniref:NADPH-dependent F420 reductase n=1 Tax=Pelomicrobium sp. TaxID=2815319 RepID=UPI002FDE66AC